MNKRVIEAKDWHNWNLVGLYKHAWETNDDIYISPQGVPYLNTKKTIGSMMVLEHSDGSESLIGPHVFANHFKCA